MPFLTMWRSLGLFASGSPIGLGGSSPNSGMMVSSSSEPYPPSRLIVPHTAHPLFDTDVLPFLIQSLIAFTPPLLTAPPPPDFAQPSQLRTSLLHADFDLLSEACSNLESLALDVEDIRLSLARGFVFPAEHQNVPCLSAILDFIEQGSYAPLWYVQHEASLDDGEVRNQEKAFDDCKAAVIKAVVEVSGEEKNTDVLCDDSEEIYPDRKSVV